MQVKEASTEEDSLARESRKPEESQEKLLKELQQQKLHVLPRLKPAKQLGHDFS